MDRPYAKNLDDPDESITLGGVVEDIVEIAGFTVGRSVQPPGWRWSTHDPRAKTPGAWCQAHHVGVVLSGRWGAELPDGSVLEWGANDVYDCPPGHDGFTVGDEPCVMIEWGGLRTFVEPGSRFGDRFLAALLFTDIVDSTARLSAIGDSAWHELLAEHYQLARAQLERFAGREIDTTGDGILATFDSPARAIRCADAIRTAARSQGLEIRSGVHVGELSVTQDGVRGIAVHVAARIMSAAGPGEILVSEVARELASSSGLAFGDSVTPELKGIEDPPTLYHYVGDG